MLQEIEKAKTKVWLKLKNVENVNLFFDTIISCKNANSSIDIRLIIDDDSPVVDDFVDKHRFLDQLGVEIRFQSPVNKVEDYFEVFDFDEEKEEKFLDYWKSCLRIQKTISLSPLTLKKIEKDIFRDHDNDKDDDDENAYWKNYPSLEDYFL